MKNKSTTCSQKDDANSRTKRKKEKPITSFFEKASSSSQSTRCAKPLFAATINNSVGVANKSSSSEMSSMTTGNAVILERDKKKRSLEMTRAEKGKSLKPIKRTASTASSSSTTTTTISDATTTSNRDDEALKVSDTLNAAVAATATAGLMLRDTTNNNTAAPTITTSSTAVSTSSSSSSQSLEEETKPKINATTLSCNSSSSATFSKNNSNNVMEQLMQRSTLADKRRSIMMHNSMISPSVATTRVPWKTTSWVLLQQSTNNATAASRGTLANNNNNNNEVNHLLAWDNMGVLLAAVSMNKKQVYIYDWDSVLAADIKGRNRRLRFKQQQQQQQQVNHCNNGSGTIPPLSSPCLFSVEATMVIPLTSLGRTFQAIAWNPYNPDELAMVHREGFIDLYDLGQVAEWHEQRVGDRGPPPHKRIMTDIPVGTLPFSLLFVRDSDKNNNSDKGHDDCSIILASGCHVVCWSRLWSKTPTLLWKLSWGKRISSLVTVNIDTTYNNNSNNLIAVGSTNGNIALIDWKRVQKASFARHSSPTLVGEWSTCRGIACPNNEWMGVYQLYVETGHGQEMNEGTSTPSASSLSSTSSISLGRCQFSWFTACGWALSMTVEVSGCKTNADKSQVHYATNHVRFQNSNGDQLGEDKNTWSLPAERVKGTGTDSVLCWEKVANVTQVLARGRDDRVLDGQSRTIRSFCAPTLLWMPRSGGSVRAIPLSKRNISLASVAIHPSHEWIVIGTETKGLRIYNARNKV